jgi:hypothetical protein
LGVFTPKDGLCTYAKEASLIFLQGFALLTPIK